MRRRKKSRRLDGKSSQSVSSEHGGRSSQVSIESPDHFDNLSLELLVKILFYLPIRSVMCMELMNRKLQEAVSMHLRVRKSIDFAEEGWYEYMPDGFNDLTFKHFLQRMPVLEYVYGVNPHELAPRWTRGNKPGFSIPGIVDALQSCDSLQGIETCHVQLLEAVLTYIELIEIMGKFANRDGTFPPDPHNRLSIPKLSRIKMLHLTGVTMPELPQIVTLEEIILEWVKLTNPQPFKDFGSRRLHTFVMRNCAGPTNALKYVPLVAGLAASHRLQRLELVRVPFLGGLFQHVIEDAWRIEGFGKLKKILIGACKNCLEIDLGYLVVCSANTLEEVTIQPSLSKDSFFSALKLADAEFRRIESLNLGYIHPFPEAEGYTNENLVKFGLADVTENPALLTDNGMKAVGEVFPMLRELTAYNCPHLHKPHLWTSSLPGNLMWCNLASLTLRRCHAIKLDSFCKFFNQLDVVKALHLEQMFREQPMGCSRVGLSAGTGIGVSSALVTNNNGNSADAGDSANDDGDQQQGNEDVAPVQVQQEQNQQQEHPQQQQAEQGEGQQQQNQPQPPEGASAPSDIDQSQAGVKNSTDKDASGSASTPEAGQSQGSGSVQDDEAKVQESVKSEEDGKKMEVDGQSPSGEKTGEEKSVAMETDDAVSSGDGGGVRSEEQQATKKSRADRSSQSSPDGLMDTSNQSCQASSQQIEEETTAAVKAEKVKLKKEKEAEGEGLHDVDGERSIDGEEGKVSNGADEDGDDKGDVEMKTGEPHADQNVEAPKDTDEVFSENDAGGNKTEKSQENEGGENSREKDSNAVGDKERNDKFPVVRTEDEAGEIAGKEREEESGSQDENMCNDAGKVRERTKSSSSPEHSSKSAVKSGNKEDVSTGKSVLESGNKTVDGVDSGKSGAEAAGEGAKPSGQPPQGKKSGTEDKMDFSDSKPSTSKDWNDSLPSTSTTEEPMDVSDSQKDKSGEMDKETKDEVTVGSQTTKQLTGASVGTSTDDMANAKKSSKTVQPTKAKAELPRRVTRQMARMEKMQSKEQKAEKPKPAPSRITTRRQARRMSENAGVVRMQGVPVSNLAVASMPVSGVSANRRGKTRSDKGTNTPRPVKRKANMCDQATSTSDPVKEDDPVQVLKLTPRTLETVTLHWCGISHLEIEGCVRLKNLQLTACRIFKDLKLEGCPDLRNLKLTQCRRLHNDSVLRAVLKLPPKSSRFVHLRPMYKFDVVSLERMLFSDLIPHNYNICLVLDHSYPPQVDTTVYMKNWLQLISDLNCDLMDSFKIPNASRIPRTSTKYPWDRTLHRFSVKYGQSPLDIVTDVPWLHFLTGNTEFPFGEPFQPVANAKEMRDITFINLDKVVNALYCHLLELGEARVPVYKDTVMVYIQLCDISGEPCDDPYA